MEEQPKVVEIYPGIWVKGCEQYLEKKSSFKNKFWNRLGYETESKEAIYYGVTGAPKKINDILKSGEVDHDKFIALETRYWSLVRHEDKVHKFRYVITYKE